MEQNEEVKKPTLMFNNLSNVKSEVKVEKSASKRSSGSVVRKTDLSKLIDNPNFIKHDLGKGVTIILTKDLEEDYSTITTLNSLLEFNKKKPNNIVGIVPELFKSFIDEENKSINTYVKVGQVVKSISKFERGNNFPRKVKEVYLKSLHDMTIVIAKLEDDSIHIAYTLEVCK